MSLYALVLFTNLFVVAISSNYVMQSSVRIGLDHSSCRYYFFQGSVTEEKKNTILPNLGDASFGDTLEKTILPNGEVM